MTTAKPDDQTLSAAELRNDLDAILARVAWNESFVVVEQDGTPLATIVQTGEIERLSRLEAAWGKPITILNRLRAALAGLSDEEVEHDLLDVVSRARDRRHATAGMQEASQPADEAGRSFWEPVSLNVLALEQRVTPTRNVSDLAGDFWPDEDPDAFVDWLRAERRRG